MSDAPEMEAVVAEPAGLESLTIVEAEPVANPFGLTEEHEFSSPAPDPEPIAGIPAEIMGLQPTVAETYGGIERGSIPIPPPAMPGTAESIFRHCPCIGVMPGRACPRCAGTKWVKTCPKCEGEMTRTIQIRRGAHARTERCGFCMGLGQVPARLSEVREAEGAARAYVAPATSAKPVYARGPQLPGVRQSSFASRAAKKGAGLPKKRRAIRGRQQRSA